MSLKWGIVVTVSSALLFGSCKPRTYNDPEQNSAAPEGFPGDLWNTLTGKYRAIANSIKQARTEFYSTASRLPTKEMMLANRSRKLQDHMLYRGFMYFCDDVPGKKTWKCDLDPKGTDIFHIRASGRSGNDFDKLILEEFDRSNYGIFCTAGFRSNIISEEVTAYTVCLSKS